MSRLIRKPILLLRALALSAHIVASAFVYALAVTVWDTIKWVNGFTPWGFVWARFVASRLDTSKPA
jgi:hypothetical protein